MIENLVDYTPYEKDKDISALEPQIGKIKINEHRPPFDAVYLQDTEGRILAYLTYKPYWSDVTTMVIESFTNEKFRKQGIQKKLNKSLLEVLNQKGVKAIVGEIQIDNSSSILNRTSVTSPDGLGVLKVDVPNLQAAEERLERDGEIKPFTLDVRVSLSETVPDNNDIVERIKKVQQGLTVNRWNDYL